MGTERQDITLGSDPYPSVVSYQILSDVPPGGVFWQLMLPFISVLYATDFFVGMFGRKTAKAELLKYTVAYRTGTLDIMRFGSYSGRAVLCLMIL